MLTRCGWYLSSERIDSPTDELSKPELGFRLVLVTEAVGQDADGSFDCRLKESLDLEMYCDDTELKELVERSRFSQFAIGHVVETVQVSDPRVHRPTTEVAHGQRRDSCFLRNSQ